MSKKILFIINNLEVGGAERLVIDDINEMLRLGIEVELITLKAEKKESLSRDLRIDKSKWINISFSGLFDIKSWFLLYREIKKRKPDLVITHLWFANTIGRLAAYFVGVKKVLSFEQNVYDSVKTRKMFFVDRFLQSLSTKIIAVSDAVKKSLIRHSIEERRIAVLHNSIDLSKFQMGNPEPEVRRELGIPHEAFIYIFIGRLIHQKAVDVLLESFKQVDSGYLLIVGQGKDRKVLEAEVKKNGLEKRVIFAGVRNDIPELLRSSDCFILPSRYEGLPLVLTEALAAGVAIIVSDFEAAKEIIVHEKNGLIVPRENAGLLAEAMMRIKGDKTLQMHLGEEAKKTSNNFSIGNHVRAILQYINI